MKNFSNIFLIASGLIAGLNIHAQSDSIIFEIADWEDFRQSAITYTFDDNCPNQYAKAVPMFDALGFNGTFYTVTSWSLNWNTLNQMALNGHEIGSHTVTHISLSNLIKGKERIQLRDSQDSINAHVTAQQCVTIAYPYCHVGDKALCAEYYIAARGCQGYVETKTPGDRFNISSIICGTQGSVNSVSTFKAKINEAVDSKGWCVFLIHGIDDDPDAYSPLYSAVLNNSLLYCKIRNYKCWVSTFANVSTYINERDNATVTALSVSDSALVIQVTDTLPDSLYHYPLTLRCPLPQQWTSATVTQNDTPVSTAYMKSDTVTYVMFRAVPDAGDVKLVISENPIELVDMEYEDEDTIGEPEIPSSIGINHNNNPSSGDGLKLNYCSGELRFELPVESGRSVKVNLYSTTGVLHSSYTVINVINGAGNVRLSDSIPEKGIVIVRVSDGKNCWSAPMIVL
ncbi:MAG: polysaccharide deacetylase family protein [Bacteroidales bacterium]|nr:polysaccharide deacetylase family protein [Bacteroidales bacterium]